MPEIDARGNYLVSPGLPRDEQLVSRELYGLLCIFGASSEIDRRRKDDEDTSSVYGWSLRSFEFVELSRILVSLAAMLRNQWDSGNGLGMVEQLGGEPTVGTWIPDLSRGAVKDLQLRESFNKILHADTLNMERSKGPAFFDGHLEPRVHLYGRHGDAEWKATIDVYQWAEGAHMLA